MIGVTGSDTPVAHREVILPMAQRHLDFDSDQLFPSISPYLEMGAYEVMWSEDGATFKRIADRFRENLDALPSSFVPRPEAEKMAAWVTDHFGSAGLEGWGVRIHRSGEYPPKLRDAANPVDLLYYAGRWEIVETPCISIVGTRKPSEDGIARARKLAKYFVDDGYTIVSGLAAGIDTAAMTTAIELGGETIAVIGTSLSACYPAANRDLQKRISREHLVISQVPAYRHANRDWRSNRSFFTERNVTMSALTRATVIVEAGNTSGTRTQARAALAQGRKLFILDSCFQNPELTWPREFQDKGAIRVREYGEIAEHLAIPEDR